MKPSMKLVVLLASSMMLQPAYAKSETHWAKKTAKIVWHAAQVAAGVYCARRIDTSVQVLKICEGKNFEECSHCGVMIVATATLLYSGISGLNEELKLAEYMNKMSGKKK